MRENLRGVALPREAIHLHCELQNGTGKGCMYRVKDALRGAFFAFKADARELHWPGEKINGNKGLDYPTDECCS